MEARGGDLVPTFSEVAQYTPLSPEQPATNHVGVAVDVDGRTAGHLTLRPDAPPELVAKAMAELLGRALTATQALRDCKGLTRQLEIDRVYFEKLFDASPEAIAVLDCDDRVVRVNREFERLFGYAEQDARGRTINDLIVPDDLQDGASSMTHEVTHGQTVRAEALRKRRDGTTFHASILGSPVLVQGDQVAVYAIYRDITAQKEAEDGLRRLSTTDELTGLFNRRGFFLLAEQMRRLAVREKAELLLLYIDVDGFKQVNDTYGHLEGDRVLADIGNILHRSFRDCDVLARMVEGGLLARMGGDEFVILAVDSGERGEEILTARLQERLDQYNDEHNRPYRISLSVGAVRVPPNRAITIDDVIASADKLMYQDKRTKD